MIENKISDLVDEYLRVEGKKLELFLENYEDKFLQIVDEYAIKKNNSNICKK